MGVRRLGGSAFFGQTRDGPLRPDLGRRSSGVHGRAHGETARDAAIPVRLLNPKRTPLENGTHTKPQTGRHTNLRMHARDDNKKDTRYDVSERILPHW